MNKVVLFTVPGSPPIIAKIVDDENQEYMVVEYPVIFMKEDSSVYTMPYMPLAKEGVVNFSKRNLLSLSIVPEEIESYYKDVVNELKLQKFIFKKEDDEVKLIKNKSKHLH